MVDYAGISARLEPRGGFPACFALSIHKAGSTLMNNMISAACQRREIPCANIPNILFNESVRDSEWTRDHSLASLFEDGRVYVGFRSLPEFFEASSILQQRQSVLLVRDPRDALVSQYFSFGGKHVSHALPAKGAEKFASRWESTAHLNIDAYVMEMAGNYLAKLTAYKTALDSKRTLLRRYEDIFFRKARFLADIFRHFGIDIPEEVTREVARKFDVRPAQERVGQHIRKGTPGDHREKLQPETIEQLNKLFGPVCRDFGYQLGHPEAVTSPSS